MNECWHCCILLGCLCVLSSHHWVIVHCMLPRWQTDVLFSIWYVLLSSYSKWTLCWILVQDRSNHILNVSIPPSSNHFLLNSFFRLGGKSLTATFFNIRQLNFLLCKQTLFVPASKSPLACGNKMSALEWNLTTERTISYVVPLVGTSFSLPWVTLDVVIPVHQCDTPSFPICIA